MTLLTALGTASFAFVALFTWHAATRAHTHGQSPRSAIAEAWLNIALGFSINYVANIFLLPLVGASFTHGQNFALGWVYTAISIVRQYTVRRWFNSRLHRIATALTHDA